MDKSHDRYHEIGFKSSFGTKRFFRRWLHRNNGSYSSQGDSSRRALTLKPMLATIAFFLLLGIWLHFHVQEGLQDTLSAKFTAILDAESLALELWDRNEKEMVRSWLNHPEFRRNIAFFMEDADVGWETQETGEEWKSRRSLKEGLEEQVKTASYEGYAIVDRSGLILIANDPLLEKNYLTPKGVALASRALQEEFLMTAPMRPEEVYGESVALGSRPVMLLAGAVTDNEDRKVAILFFSFYPGEDFNRIFSLGHLGSAGDSFAFNSDGFMISESRNLAQAEKLGILADSRRKSAILNIRLLNPQRGSQGSEGAEAKMSNAALTKMARSALLGESRMNLKGYGDHRGVEVVGAWRWLDQFGFGIAVEVEKSQAYRMLSPIRAAVVVLFSLLIASTLLLLLFRLKVGQLRSRISEIEHLGSYNLEAEIGEGGMGRVFKASHALLKRPAAVKLLKSEGVTPGAVTRFEREVQLTSRLSHPNTIVIYDYGRTPEGLFYYVMEYLEGFTLARLLDEFGAAPPARAVNILRQICGSLVEAHSIGLIHRDLKPTNIMLCTLGGIYDYAKVLDFGMVKNLRDRDSNSTAPQVLYGAPCYIAPERIEDPARCDARTDIYSLGAIAFNLVTGRDVFEGLSSADILLKVVHEEPPRPSAIAPYPIPSSLDDHILSCLAKDPDLRPQSVENMLGVLNDIKTEDTWTQRQAREWWQENTQELSPSREDAETSMNERSVKTA